MSGVTPEIAADFIVEAQEILDRLGEQLVTLEHATDDRDQLNAVFRGFHTLKGGAGFLGIHAMVELCHAAEETLGSVRSGEAVLEPQHFDAAQRSLDWLQSMLDAVAGFVVDLLRRCSRVRIIATSREPLGVEGEQVIVVPPLAIDTDAVDLFIDRAGHVDRSFAADDRAPIADICRCLDGIPLGIELAAARVRELPLDDLRVRLAERLDVLRAALAVRYRW